MGSDYIILKSEINYVYETSKPRHYIKVESHQT